MGAPAQVEGSHYCAAVLLVESKKTCVLCLKPATILVFSHQRNSLELDSCSSEVSGCTTPPQHKPPVAPEQKRMVMRTQVGGSSGEVAKGRLAIRKSAGSSELGNMGEKRGGRRRWKRKIGKLEAEQCAFCEFTAKNQLLMVMHLRFDHTDKKNELEE